MTFKKDYINYLLFTVVNSPENGFRDNYRLNKLVDTVMNLDDVMKVTYLVGKTAGLEPLFKYLLYISDKIDKSQLTIFNVKDNFDYDINNLKKICERINEYKSDSHRVMQDVEAAADNDSGNMIINVEDDIVIVESVEVVEISEEEQSDAEMTLIENKEGNNEEKEVFELDSLTDSLESSDEIEDSEKKSGEDFPEIEDSVEESETEENEASETEITETKKAEEIISESVEEVIVVEEITSEASIEEEAEEDLPEIEIEVHKPDDESGEQVREEGITSEAYYKFETKFFEEVKILEKLLVSVEQDCTGGESGKLGEKCLQCLTEIIEITSELSSLSRQLSFDLIADVFLTMNLYFTKVISHPSILTSERINLFDSSLSLVNSLIKGEDYLNYDTIVDKIEILKADISGEPEEKYSEPETEAAEIQSEEINDSESVQSVQEPEKEVEMIAPKKEIPQSKMDSAVFKLKYLVKEFEKSFSSLDNIKGEYSKFDAMEKISELNNSLRLIAKISSMVKLKDVLKLSEVTYVFLKYVKDYRMDLMEPEIKQIVKYIIFTFKMLLTNRKPEDFNVLVQHLNNPVKIFTDS